MADKKIEDFTVDNDDTDFDALAEFQVDGKDSPFAAADNDDLDFASTVGADDAGFSFDNDEFGSSDDDDADIFASDDLAGSGFDIDSIPSPESVDRESMTGDADEEFGDFGSDDASDGMYDAFSGDDDVDVDTTFTDGEAEAITADAYDSDNEELVDVDDPFLLDEEENDNELEDDDQESYMRPEVAAASNASSKFSSNLIRYGVVGALVTVVGFVGYTQVIPMFMPSNQPPVIAQVDPVVSSPDFPTALPSSQNNLPEPVAQPEQNNQQGELPGFEQPNNGSNIPAIDLGGNSLSPEQNQPVVVMDPPQDVASNTTLELPGATTLPTTAVPIDEIVGGPRSGGIEAMKNNAASGKSDDMDELSDKIDAVMRRISNIETKVASLETSFNNQIDIGSGNPMNFGLAPSMSNNSPETSGVNFPSMTNPQVAANIMPPLKPEIIESVILRGVSGDIGWVSTNGSVVEVKVGDVVANAGTIESFQNYRGRWIAVTDKGIILPK